MPGIPVEPGSQRKLIGAEFGYQALSNSGSLACQATFFAPDDPSEAGLYVYDGAEFVPLLRAGLNDGLTLSSRPVQNDSGGVTFRYLWGCETDAYDSSDYPDLNLLIVPVFGAAYQLTWNTHWLDV